MSPEKYIREKVRTLPKGPCYISADDGKGLVQVVVSRLHKGGKVSAAFYLVDKYCLGVKLSFYKLRLEDSQFEDMLDIIRDYYDLQEISYNEAHNWIYGAIAFAEEAGIKPDNEFRLTKYFLDEDNEDIPLIEYKFGDKGKHHLIAMNKLEASKYLPLLCKNLGYDFSYTLDANNIEDDYDENFESDYDDDYNEEIPFREEREYTYKHPEYPHQLSLNHPDMLEIIDNPDNSSYLTDGQIDTILALPQDTLRQDLENIILYSLGVACDGIPSQLTENPVSGALGHAIILLGEVGNGDSSVNAVLEVLRQNESFFMNHIYGSSEEFFPATLCNIGKGSLEKLRDFVFEEGIYNTNKAYVVEAVTQMDRLSLHLHEEIIEWFRSILTAAAKGPDKALFTDSDTNGLIVSILEDIDSEELLPEIKKLFDIGYVDEEMYGDYDSVVSAIRHKTYANQYMETEIHRRYARLKHLYVDD